MMYPTDHVGMVKEKFPSFNLVNVKEYKTIIEIIETLNKEPSPKIIKGSEGKYKIIIHNAEDFRAMLKILEKKAIEWFNYQNRNDRPIKVVA